MSDTPKSRFPELCGRQFSGKCRPKAASANYAAAKSGGCDREREKAQEVRKKHEKARRLIESSLDPDIVREQIMDLAASCGIGHASTFKTPDLD